MVRWLNSPLQFPPRWKETKFEFMSNQCKQTICGRYKLLYEIGHGASAIVHLAIDMKTKKKYAVKEISKSRLKCQHRLELFHQQGPTNRRRRPVCMLSAEEANDIQLKKRKLNSNFQQQKMNEETLIIRETDILKQLPKHTNIIKFVEVLQDPKYEDSIFIVTEFAEKGVVMDVVPYSTTKPYSDAQCRHIFKQLVGAVDHLHQNNMIHGDIKPQNLILTNDDSVKLIDFGSAACITNILDYGYRSSGSLGSPAFMAPELLKKKAVLENEKVNSPTCADIWSMGITLYCLAYGHLPFERTNILELYSDIHTKPVEHSAKIDRSLKNLIDRLLAKDPKDRITMKEIKVKTHTRTYIHLCEWKLIKHILFLVSSLDAEKMK
ncbi:MAG: kinase-like domain-containing protein [Benjaminiella poitrasii]|nr:MAG: kinase-like domain-containing protein [Benjaminiella poitrasii]